MKWKKTHTTTTQTVNKGKKEKKSKREPIEKIYYYMCGMWPHMDFVTASQNTTQQ